MDEAVYKLDAQSSGIVNVSPDGVVHTKDTLGRDLIIVSVCAYPVCLPRKSAYLWEIAFDLIRIVMYECVCPCVYVMFVGVFVVHVFFGFIQAKTVDQTLPIGIEVKNVQYILVTLLPDIKLKQAEHKIPRGMNFVFKISLHDNLGNEFSHNIEDVNGLRYELATKDVVDAQIGNNLTIAVSPRPSNLLSLSLPFSVCSVQFNSFLPFFNVLSEVHSKSTPQSKNLKLFACHI